MYVCVCVWSVGVGDIVLNDTTSMRQHCGNTSYSTAAVLAVIAK